MQRRIAIIDGHPDPDRTRLCHTLADAYTKSALQAGHEVERIDVATLDFPVLRRWADFYGDTTPPAGIAPAQAAIGRADHLLIVYPLWLGTMPALLKAFLEQTLRPGFAIATDDDRKLLAGRSARLVVTMGMPAVIYRWFYGAHSLRSLERNVLKFCGIKPVRTTLFGLVDKAGDGRAERWFAKMAKLGAAGR